ncbi:MAG TPA: aminotransferase class III-fold pyridoxal phosphate-dependent enzyme [Myxococcota bacterium]|nr:aminotransferase class III-fold pyridoxal phosphate-dependent enzyme [Myxococcota bacterium]
MRPADPTSSLDKLHTIRHFGGHRVTQGLPDDVVARFAALDPDLRRAIDEAAAHHADLQPTWSAALAGPESALVETLQEHFVNFYERDAINPYVPLAARGPWIVTSHGAVLHDSGGYGMLGFGHAPDAILAELARPQAMANIMTPSFSQRRLTDALRAEVGHTRQGGCPYPAFVCMNSGSESVTVAARISDINALRVTGPGGRFPGRKVKFLALAGGFHGRTDRPAQASGSSRDRYRQHLLSFQTLDNLDLVRPNDVEGLRQAFAEADRAGVFYEMMLFEPVMGEGNPGLGVTREFYDTARALTRRSGTLLLADSIQAGLRAHGVLSLVDYPGFSDIDPPDMETWSKAINAAQFPLSVLGLGPRAAELYQRGVYGNTMTANPRACDVGAATLGMITPELRANVVARGEELRARLAALADHHPGVITSVQGTGLLVCAEIHPTIPVVGPDGVELWCRRHGMGVIHGGHNALRFTPHFAISTAEIDLIVDIVRRAVDHFAGARSSASDGASAAK